MSLLAVALGARDRPGGEGFRRQLAWRDFYHRVTAAVPDLARKNHRRPATTSRGPNRSRGTPDPLVEL